MDSRYYGKHPKYGQYVDADIMALKAGHVYGEATEQLMASYEVKPAKFPPGDVSQYHGRVCDVAWIDSGFAEGGYSAGLRQLSDYAGKRDSPRTLEAQEFRDYHDADGR